MANASLKIIDALRKTAATLEHSTSYQWGHMGLCNCGFLAQEITHLRKGEIHTRAMLRSGDWNEQLNDYCPTSGFPMDVLISEMIAFGFDTDDLKHLERLSDPRVLRTIPFENRNLIQNSKQDVIKYLWAWASGMEEELMESITLPMLAEQARVPA